MAPRRSLDWYLVNQDPALVERRADQGARWITASTLVRSAAELAVLIALARLLSPREFGLVGMATAVTGFVAVLRDFGLANATIQKKQLQPAQLHVLFWINLGASILFGSLIAALGPALALFYGERELAVITPVLGAGLLIDGLSLQHGALLRRRMLFERIAVIEIASSLASAATALLLAWWGMGLWALVLRLPVAAGAGLLLSWALCDYRPRWALEIRSVADILRSGAHLSAFGSVNYLARNLDDVLVGKYAGAVQLGFYQKAYDMLMLPLHQIARPAGAVAIPALSRLVDDSDRYRHAFLGALRRTLTLTIAIGITLMAAPEAFVAVALGDDWQGADEVFFWLGWLTFTQPVGNATGWLFISQNRSAELLRWGILGSLLSIASFVVGIRWGALGVAVAYSMSGLFLRAPMVVLYAGRVGPVGIRQIARAALPLQAAGLGAWLAGSQALSLLPDASPLWRCIAAAISCGSALTLSLLIFPSGRATLVEIGRAFYDGARS